MILFPSRRRADHLTERPVFREDIKLAGHKVATMQYVVVGTFLFLLAGFWELQVRDQELYSQMADRNRIKAHPIPAPRGKILDRDGRVIVDNHSTFSVLLARENLKESHLKQIAEGLHLDYDDLQARIRRFRSRPRYEAIIIKEGLTPGELAFVEAHKDPDSFPELEIIHTQRRLYPQDGALAHVLGYVGEISENELNVPDYARYNQGDVIGKAGIERQYNDVLMGVDGQRQVIVDNRGVVRQVLGSKDAVPGKPLSLTIDLELQAVAELAMDGHRGAVVAMDPRTGEVLAVVSRPAYDPNRFAGRIRTRDWKEISENPDKPLLNRAIQGQLAPGSTFKPIVALAALESGEVDPSFQVNCGGGAVFYGRPFKCHLRGGHGHTELNRALAQSCDVYFYNLGNRIGIDTIAKYGEMAGLGKRTGIDLPYEAAGELPSTAWKIRKFRSKWYAGETISVAIGQGALTVTPLQLAAATGGLAMGGVWHRPHLVKYEGAAPPPSKAELNPDNVARVINGMYAVVNEGGTAARARIPGIELCGKTGTAQLASNEFLKSKAGQGIKDNAWFVGFAPKTNPEIVVAALFESGEHGNLAAPIARDIVKAYFDKKARRTPAPALLAERR